ncbi:hypothetical protein PCANC_05308 [Puccinia coronata f. sp. avenae]|uniref:Uncharacterized protein n=1 Tax=Puccinia coronata f. sp. avenae TaxID=200324 RepID=A0A2N5VYR4_9BASI|nr:hypothetical protein PCANC_05308 [Puccinia coronata f. sp. avenae]
MVLFRTRKPSTIPDDDSTLAPSSDAVPNRIISPNHAQHALKQYSFALDLTPTHHRPRYSTSLAVPSSLSTDSSHPCATAKAQRSSSAAVACPPLSSLQRSNSVQAFPRPSPLPLPLPHPHSHHQHHPHQLASRSRLSSFMGSTDQQQLPSTGSAIAAGQSSFRLLKSKLFASTPKFKQFTQPGLASANSSTGLPYQSPSLASSSDQLLAYANQSIPAQRQNAPYNHHPLQGAQKFNTFTHARALNTTNSSTSKEETVDNWVHLDQSTTPRPSGDFVRPVSGYGAYSPSPANRIVIDSNPTRRNFPHFNHKLNYQEGPKVTRINTQMENYPYPSNTPLTGNSLLSEPFSNVQSQLQSQLSQLQRPTPLPHGGSGAILFNPTQSTRVNEPRQAFPDPVPPSAPLAAKPAAFFPPAAAATDRAATHMPAGHHESLIPRHQGSQQPDPSNQNAPQQSFKAGPSPPRNDTLEISPAHVASPQPDLNQLSASPIERDEDGSGSAATQTKNRPPPIPAPAAAKPHATGTSSLTIVQAVSKPVIEVEAARPPLSSMRSPTVGTLDLEDFTYMFNQSLSSISTPKTDVMQFKHNDPIPNKTNSFIRHHVPPPLTLAPPDEESIHGHPAPSSLLSHSTPHATSLTPDPRYSLGSPLPARSNRSASPHHLTARSSTSASSHHLTARSDSSVSPRHPIGSRESLQALAFTPSGTSTPVKLDRPIAPASSPHSTASASPAPPNLPSLPAPSPLAPTLAANPSPVSLSHPPQLDHSNSPSSRSAHPEPPPPPPADTQSQFQLEHARQLILGLQDQIKQLQDASLNAANASSGADQRFPHPSSPLPLPPDTAVPPHDANAQPSSSSAQSIPSDPNSATPKTTAGGDVQHDELVGTVSPNTNPISEDSAGTANQNPNPQQIPSPQYQFPSHNEGSTGSLADDADRDTAGSNSQSVPSRLPVAQHRLRGMASTEFERFSPNSGGSVARRKIKASITSSINTDYRYDTPESYSTQLTTPSPISTNSTAARSNGVLSAKQAFLPERVRAGNTTSSSHGGDGRSRERQNFRQLSHDSNHDSNRPSRMTGRAAAHQEAQWLPSRSPHDPNTIVAAPRSLSSLSQVRARPDHVKARANRQQSSPSTSLPSIKDGEESSCSDSELDSFFERDSHGLSRHASRTGLDSVNEDSALDLSSGQFNKVSLRLMTKTELVTIIKKQRHKLENTRTEFAAERDDLLDTLAQTREKEAHLSRERERLMAEDAWKTDELSKAREEIGWLSRLADTLELEKSRLETRANSMANELKRAVVDLRTVSTASSQGLIGPSSRDSRTHTSASSYQTRARGQSHGKEDFIHERKSESSTSQQYYRTRQESCGSFGSAGTVRRAIPKLGGSTSQSNLRNPEPSARLIREPQEVESAMMSPKARELHHMQQQQQQRKGPGQRSVPDFRSPLSPLRMHFQQHGRHERPGSRTSSNSRRPSGSRSISSSHSHTEEQQEPEKGGTGGGLVDERFREDVIIEEEQEEPRPARDTHWEDDAFEPGPDHDDDDHHHHHPDSHHPHNPHHHHHHDHRRSPSSSLSSPAISPSSTVFADHHRDHHRDRPTTLSPGPLDQQSNVYRSSLISLQLRPEDELFLENYLEEEGHDGLDSDMDY